MQSTSPNKKQTRRDFLKKGSGWIFLFPMVTGLGTGCLGQLFFHAKAEQERLFVPLEKLAKLSDERKTLTVVVTNQKHLIYVRRLKTGGYIALSSRCTHRGCTLDPEPSGFDCPCHGSTFDPQGKVLTGPAMDPLPRYNIKQTTQGIQIQLT